MLVMIKLSKSKTVTRTFSLRKELVDALEKEALSRNISTSSLMNQTLEKSIQLNWPSEKTKALVIARDIIKRYVDALPLDVLHQIGSLSAQEHKHTALILMGTHQTLDSVLDLLSINYGKNARWFNLTHAIKGKENRVLLNHDMGLKWSVFLEAYVRSFLIEMLDIPIRSNYSDNTVVFEFKL